MGSPDVEKTPDQKAFIQNLAVGEEKEFSFKGVAFIYNNFPEAPDMPQSLEVVVESFEAGESVNFNFSSDD